MKTKFSKGFNKLIVNQDPQKNFFGSHYWTENIYNSWIIWIVWTNRCNNLIRESLYYSVLQKINPKNEGHEKTPKWKNKAPKINPCNNYTVLQKNKPPKWRSWKNTSNRWLEVFFMTIILEVNFMSTPCITPPPSVDPSSRLQAHEKMHKGWRE